MIELDNVVTPIEFFTRIVEEYHSARSAVEGADKILRGRSRSISALAEEIFASYLVQSDPSIQKVFVDQPFTSVNPVDGKKRTNYPDLAVVKSDTIIALFDFKMDMGWNRGGLLSICERHSEFVCAVQGGDVTYSEKMIVPAAGRQTIGISSDCTYDVVIASSKNWNKAGIEHLNSIGTRCQSVTAYLLSDGTHPNERSFTNVCDVVDNLNVRHEEFDKITSKLRSFTGG